MKLKELTKQELESMSYDDIAFMILTESNKKMKINELFKKVCDLLELSENAFLDNLPGFFEVLSTDQRFTMLKDGFWDLKEKHKVSKVVIDDEEDEDDVLADALEDEEEFEEDEEEEDIYYDNDETDDQGEDDLKGLVIIDEEDEANGLN